MISAVAGQSRGNENALISEANHAVASIPPAAA